MLRKCIECKHCEGVMEHYENVPEMFSHSLEFYCLKDNKHLGGMVKRRDEVEYLDCIEEKQKEQEW